MNQILYQRGKLIMPSAEYINAKKEFRNCLLMSLYGLGVPIIIAFKEWLPIMRAEKAKERAAQKG